MEQFLSDDERAKNIGILAGETFCKDVSDLSLDCLLQTVHLGVVLLHQTGMFHHIIHPSIELWLRREGCFDQRIEIREGLVVDGGDHDSISRRERRDDLSDEILLKQRPILSLDACREVDEDDDICSTGRCSL